ncbi:MAG: hypothetical protein JJ864_09165 [Rhizobiaceae bacterium]|nr:hypothetical protein [Rhizobiaceae bacterium]
MTIVVDDLGDCSPSQRADRAKYGSFMRRTLRRLIPAGPSWATVVAKKDDRLLRDIGLTRREALGVSDYFRYEWNRRPEPWSL